MTFAPPAGPLADPATRILALPLAALAAAAADAQCITDGMPGGSLLLPQHNLVLAATPCDTMFDDAVARIVSEQKRDVALFRTGFFPETLNPVRIHLGLAGPDALVLHNMALFRHRDASLWLVPPTPLPVFIEIDPTGLRMVNAPPFITADERSDGLCRAAAEVVRTCNRRRGR